MQPGKGEGEGEGEVEVEGEFIPTTSLRHMGEHRYTSTYS
jgi:hypothetical protein